MANQSQWRLELLARLATERSFLLRQLWALDAATIESSDTGNGRSPKNLIAHIGAWDSLILSQIRLVGNGRVHKIEPHNTPNNRPAFNADIRQRYQQYDLKLTLAFALRERSGLLYALSQLSDGELTRSFTLPWGEETNLHNWAVQQHQHDARHAQELADWRKTLPLPAKRQIGPKLILRAILKATRKEVLALVDLFPAVERETRPVRGDWTLKEAIGRLTDWTLLITDGLRQLLLGETPRFAESIADFAAYDAVKVVARGAQNWAEVQRDFHAAHRALDEAFQKYPELFLNHTLTTPWGKEMPAYYWLTILFGQDHDLAINLRRTLNLSGWSERLTRQDAVRER